MNEFQGFWLETPKPETRNPKKENKKTRKKTEKEPAECLPPGPASPPQFPTNETNEAGRHLDLEELPSKRNLIAEAHVPVRVHVHDDVHGLGSAVFDCRLISEGCAKASHGFTAVVLLPARRLPP